MKRTQKWLVIAGALGSIFVVGFAAREMLFAQQNNRPQNDTWGPNSIPLPLPNPNARQIPMPAMVPPVTTPPPQAVSPYPGGPTASIPYSGVQQWTPGPQSFPPSHPNPSYPTPYPLPTISASTGYVPSSVHVSSGAYAPPGNIHLSPASHSNTLATSRLLQQYAACDDEAKKEELVSQIKKLVTSEFEEKHSVTKRMLESLEKTTQKLREATEKREASKDKIIADRVASLVGRTDGTAWDFDEPTATEIRVIGLPMLVSPTLGTMSAPGMPNPAYPLYPNAYPNAYPAYAPYPPTSYPPTSYPPTSYPPAPSPPAITPPSSVYSPGPSGDGPASLLPTNPTATSPSELNDGESNEVSSQTTKPSEPSE